MSFLRTRQNACWVISCTSGKFPGLNPIGGLVKIPNLVDAVAGFAHFLHALAALLPGGHVFDGLFGNDFFEFVAFSDIGFVFGFLAGARRLLSGNIGH